MACTSEEGDLSSQEVEAAHNNIGANQIITLGAVRRLFTEQTEIFKEHSHH